MIYATAVGLQTKPISQQRAIFLHTAGEVAQEIYFTFALEETATTPTIEEILQAFHDYYFPRKQTAFIRNIFFSTDQKSGQLFDDFVTEIKSKSVDCEFGELRDSLIRDRITLGVRNRSLREKYLQEGEIALEKVIDFGRAVERSQIQMGEISGEKSNVKDVFVVTRDNVEKKGHSIMCI